MSPQDKAMPSFALSAVLLIDICDFTLMKLNDQLGAVVYLTTVVRDEATSLGGLAAEICLPTGDGMAICSTSVDKLINLARGIHGRYTKDNQNRMTLKIGITAGVATGVEDINWRPNLVGSSLNRAQRMVSCCNGGHILVQHFAMDAVSTVGKGAAFRGPYDFIVKHGETLTAYSYNEEGIGNPTPPLKNRYYKTNYRDLVAALAECDVKAHFPVTKNMPLAYDRPAVVVEHTVLEMAVCGFNGIPSENVDIQMIELEPRLPSYIWEDRLQRAQRAQPDEVNGKKAYLADWWLPVANQENRLRLTLGPTDYWTSDAVKARSAQIRDAIDKGELNLFQLPRQLNCHVIAITKDSRMVLGKRPPDVAFEKGLWGASIGKSIDLQEDVAEDGKIDPTRTVRRALRRELKLPAGIEVDVTYIALATETHYCLAVLMAVAALRTLTYDEVLSAWEAPDGLPDRDPLPVDRLDGLSSIPIDDIEPALHFALTDTDPEQIHRPQYGTSRLAVLATLCNRFGYDEVLKVLDGIHRTRKVPRRH